MPYTVCMNKIAYKSNHHVYYSCKYHVVWCPKYRRKVLVEEVAMRLTQIMREVCQEHQAEVLSLEVMPDHVHVLVSYPPDVALADFLREAKSESARRVNSARLDAQRVRWCRGYYAGSLSRDHVITARSYLGRQFQRHANRIPR